MDDRFKAETPIVHRATSLRGILKNGMPFKQSENVTTYSAFFAEGIAPEHRSSFARLALGQHAALLREEFDLVDAADDRP
jgi:hypothetical protein